MGNTTIHANREVCDLIFVDYATKVPFLECDYANVTTTELTGETTYAYGGKGHPKRIAFSGERGGTISIETQIRTMDLYSLVTGADIETAAKILSKEEQTASAAGSLTLSDTPIAGSVYLYNRDDVCGTALQCTVTGKSISSSDIKANKDYTVLYMTEKNTGTQTIKVKSTTFPKAFTVYGDTIVKFEDGTASPYRIKVAKCIPQSNISFSFSNTGDPGALTITCDMMADENDDIYEQTLIRE